MDVPDVPVVMDESRASMHYRRRAERRGSNAPCRALITFQATLAVKSQLNANEIYIFRLRRM